MSLVFFPLKLDPDAQSLSVLSRQVPALLAQALRDRGFEARFQPVFARKGDALAYAVVLARIPDTFLASTLDVNDSAIVGELTYVSGSGSEADPHVLRMQLRRASEGPASDGLIDTTGTVYDVLNHGFEALFSYVTTNTRPTSERTAWSSNRNPFADGELPWRHAADNSQGSFMESLHERDRGLLSQQGLRPQIRFAGETEKGD